MRSQCHYFSSSSLNANIYVTAAKPTGDCAVHNRRHFKQSVIGSRFSS